VLPASVSLKGPRRESGTALARGDEANSVNPSITRLETPGATGSTFAKTSAAQGFGLLLLIVIFLALFGCAVWLIVKGQKQDRSYSENQPSPKLRS
jgi:hypothetical protein